MWRIFRRASETAFAATIQVAYVDWISTRSADSLVRAMDRSGVPIHEPCELALPEDRLAGRRFPLAMSCGQIALPEARRDLPEIAARTN